MADSPQQQEIQPGTFEEPDSAGRSPDFDTSPPTPMQDIERLRAYLAEHFPAELTAPPGRPEEDTPVDVAMRLMTRLSTTAHPSQITRCSEAFCNKPEGHNDEHGWVSTQ